MGISEIQGYASFFMTIFFVIMLYGYIMYLYRSEKKGERDFEKYSNIALDDEIDSAPVENKTAAQKRKEETK